MGTAGQADADRGGLPPPDFARTEFDQAVRAHAQHYAKLIERVGPGLDGAGRPDGGQAQSLALKRLRIELGNFRRAAGIALRMCQEQPAGHAAAGSGGRAAEWLQPLTHYLYRVFDRLGESRAADELYAQLLDGIASQATALELPILVGLAQARWRLGDLARARAVAQRALPLARAAGDSHHEAVLLSSRGTVAFSEGDYTAARDWHTQALAVCQAAGDRRGEAISLGNLALVAGSQGSYAVARELNGHALALRRAIGDRAGEAYSLSHLGLAEWEEGNWQAARAAHEQALAIRRELGDRRGTAYSLNDLALVTHGEGDYSRTVELYSQALAIFHEVGDRRGEAYAFCNLADAEFTRVKYHEAAGHLCRALDLFSAVGDRAGLARACILAGAILLGQLDLPAGTRLLQGGGTAVTALGHRLEPAQQITFNAAQARLAAAVEAGEASPADVERWREQGGAMSLGELAEFTLSALEHARVSPPAAF